MCNTITNETYTSACAAGCTDFNATSSVFSGCSCVVGNPLGGNLGGNLAGNLAGNHGGNFGGNPGGNFVNLVSGFCPTDCSSNLYYFMLTSFILSLILTMGKVTLSYFS